MIGYKLDLKSLGKRSALNAHAAFDEADAGNTIGLIGAPVLDPTRENAGVKLPCVTRLGACGCHNLIFEGFCLGSNRAMIVTMFSDVS